MGAPIRVGDTVFVHGTRSVGQAIRDWPSLALWGTPAEEREVFDLVRRPGVRAVVGHSLGAAWALHAARRYHRVIAGTVVRALVSCSQATSPTLATPSPRSLSAANDYAWATRWLPTRPEPSPDGARCLSC